MLRLLAENDDAELFFQFGMLFRQQFARFYQIVDSFPLIRYLYRAEQSELGILRQFTSAARFLLVVRLEQVGIDGIGNTGNRVSGEQGAFLCQAFQPVAARYEVDVPSFVQILFFVESPVGEVFFAAIAMNERTVTALLLIAGTLAGMMADTGARPHVVHGPHYGFARCEDILDVSQR